MAVALIAIKDLSVWKYQSEGVGVFPKASSLRVPPVAGTEMPKVSKLENVSRFTPRLRLLNVRDLSLLVEVSLQMDGGYMAKTSADNFDAVGQGDTEEEAIRDIRCAIELLKDTISKKVSE